MAHSIVVSVTVPEFYEASKKAFESIYGMSRNLKFKTKCQTERKLSKAFM